MPDWYTLETLRTDWREAPSSDSLLQQLIDASQQQILAFDNGYNWRLTTHTDDDGNPIDFPGDYPAGAVPNSLVMGQRMQARNLWNANRVDPQSGADGDDTFVLRPYPLDWVIKQVIRPKRAVASFG